jgi:hypothetical protein
MNGVHDNNQNPNLQCLPSLCRGIYNRVAQKLGCDPSYVSRVARGERKSAAISEALRAEIQFTWAKVSEGIAESTDQTSKRRARAAAD